MITHPAKVAGDVRQGVTADAVSRLLRLAGRLESTLCALVLSAGGLCGAPAAELAPPDGQLQELTHGGVKVSFSVTPVVLGATNVGPIRAGEDFAIRFGLTDETTGAPLKGVYPEAWINVRPPPQVEGLMDLVKEIQKYRSGTLIDRPLIDLNNYLVVTLNNDATLGVVDPLFGFGGSKLLALVKLASPGADWVLSADQSTLFVSLPDADQIAVVDTRLWRVRANLSVAHGPSRLVVLPDGQTLWVTHRGSVADGALPGLSAFNTSDGTRRAEIPTQDQATEIVASRDGHWLYALNGSPGSLAVIDTHTAVKLRELNLGAAPTSMAFSAQARALYVTDEATGDVTIIDGERNEIVRRIPTSPGATLIRFEPAQRFGFVINPGQKSIAILDAALGRVVQTRRFEDAPSAVEFSDRFAYLSSPASETVMMVALDGLGREGAALSCSDFPGGQRPPGSSGPPIGGARIVIAPGESAVLLANALDKVVYYYKEGMAAPMGHFSNYDREPRAVLALDRTLKVRLAPGVYETVTRVSAPGRYLVYFYLNSPRFAHCFELSVGAATGNADRPRGEIVEVTGPARWVAGLPGSFSFRAQDPLSGKPCLGIGDFGLMFVLVPGSWHRWLVPQEVSAGTYTVDFTPPKAGRYDLFLRSPSLGLDTTRISMLSAAPGAVTATVPGPPPSSLVGVATQANLP